MNKRYLELAENMVMLANEDEKDEFLNSLYIVLHLANWTCKNPHESWQEEIEPLFKKYWMEWEPHTK